MQRGKKVIFVREQVSFTAANEKKKCLKDKMAQKTEKYKNSPSRSS